MSAGGAYTLRPGPGWSALVGLQAGIVAGVAALGWCMGASAMAGRSALEMPLSLAAAFYGSSGFPYWSWRGLLAGYAAHFVVSGLTGACYGLVASRTGSRRRALLLGVLAGILMYMAGRFCCGHREGTAFSIAPACSPAICCSARCWVPCMDR